MTRVKTTADVGCLVRNSFRRFLETEKFKRNELDIRYREVEGFCASTFFIEVEGPYAEEWMNTLHKVTEQQ